MYVCVRAQRLFPFFPNTTFIFWKWVDVDDDAFFLSSFPADFVDAFEICVRYKYVCFFRFAPPVAFFVRHDIASIVTPSFSDFIVKRNHKNQQLKIVNKTLDWYTLINIDNYYHAQLYRDKTPLWNKMLPLGGKNPPSEHS